jgi:hypothetical protein
MRRKTIWEVMKKPIVYIFMVVKVAQVQIKMPHSGCIVIYANYTPKRNQSY